MAQYSGAIAVIIGTWNLEVYPSTSSRRGIAMAEILDAHEVDVWLLTELHSDWNVEGMRICFAPPRAGAPDVKRKSAIATSWTMEPIEGGDDPAEGRLCLARLTDPNSSRTVLVASSVLPWRGSTPYWREVLNRKDMSYAEVYRHVLDFTVDRIADERLPGEDVIWGGDYNQALTGRDYVGTLQGRSDLQAAINHLGLWAATAESPALTPSHPAIDHITIPLDWALHGEPTVLKPKRNDKPLSDHALYFVEANM